MTCNLAIGFKSRVNLGRIVATVETVLLRVGVVMEMLLHSNGNLQISTVAGRISLFATCGRVPWKENLISR
jgi:hypothetical protein